MNNTAVKTQVKNKISRRRSVVTATLWAAAAVSLAVYFLFRNAEGFAPAVITHFSFPVRRAVGWVCSFVPFSVMELLYVLLGGWVIFFLVRTVVWAVKGKLRLRGVLRRILTFLLVAVYIFTGYCWLFGIDYRGASFSEKAGLADEGVSAEDLVAVTKLFALRANELSDQVARDDDGHFAEDRETYFVYYEDLYDGAEALFPILTYPSYRPKAMVFSQIMSRMGFTGVFFPFTGETNINIAAPAATLPFTIAHELAHQRGVVAEQECNFLGVLACETSGNTVYEYSGAFMGLLYLMDAVYKADRDAWTEIYDSLSDGVITDWQDNNAYWASMESHVTAVSASVYNAYLTGNGQELGIRSYGACVDLLVEYYSQNTLG